MAIACPKCGAEYDVTLFTFDRGIRCDCGEWVDMAVGHRRAAEGSEQASLETDVEPRVRPVTDSDDDDRQAEHADFLDYLNDRFCGFTGS